MGSRLETKTLRAESKSKGIVLLGHAMFNTFDYYFKPAGKSLADFLSKNGYDVTVFHLTGYGKSPKAQADTGFDQYVDDYSEFINGLDSNLPLYFIGHSVGGVAGLSAIANSKKKFEKIILVAPALWPFTDPKINSNSLKQRLQLKLMTLLSKPTGNFPMSVLGLGDVPAPHGHFFQLNRWAKLGQVVSLDKSKIYSDEWKQIDCPICIFSGSKDTSMAPRENVRWIKNQIGETARLEEVHADHFGIIYGKTAAQDVWPKFIDFFNL
jgi:pimeloyl-ACP methyl ester carboxylesterase